MTKLRKDFFQYNEKFVSNLLFLVNNAEHLNEWECSLVENRLRAFKKYKFAAVASDKQGMTVTRLVSAVKLLKLPSMGGSEVRQ